MPEAKSNTKQKIVTVKLHHDHTHAGQPCKPGDTLEVTEAQAEILSAQGVLTEPTKEQE